MWLNGETMTVGHLTKSLGLQDTHNLVAYKLHKMTQS